MDTKNNVSQIGGIHSNFTAQWGDYSSQQFIIYFIKNWKRGLQTCPIQRIGECS